MSILDDRPQTARTACKECVFAIYKNKTQIGCKLGRLERLVNNGATLLEATDNHTNFYVIENRFCSAFRPEIWNDSNDPVAKVNKELALQPDIIIYANKNNTENDIIETYRSIFSYRYCSSRRYEGKPNHIYILLDECNINEWELLEKLPVIEDVKRTVTRTLGQYNSLYKTIDTIVYRLQSNYFIAINAGISMPMEYLGELNLRMNYDLERIVLDNTVDGILVVQKLVYKMYICLSEDSPPLERILQEYPEGYSL